VWERRLEQERGNLLALENRVSDLSKKIVQNKLDVAETVVRIPQTIVLQQPAYGYNGGPLSWVSPPTVPPQPPVTGCNGVVNAS
jgi:hypothetical protein